MKTFNSLTNLIMRRGNLNHNCGRLLTVLVLLFSLSIGNAWGSSYYAKLTVKTENTAKGLVYGNVVQDITGDDMYTDQILVDDEISSQNSAVTYYAWAKAKRGSKFNGWTYSKAPTSSPSSPTGKADAIKLTKPSSSGSTEITATANFTQYSRANITYQAPENGVYEVEYRYIDYDETAKEFKHITTSFAVKEGEGRDAVESYSTDTITLTSTSANFLDWYNVTQGTTIADNVINGVHTCVYTAPNGGNVTLVARFSPTKKFYGEVMVKLAPSSTADGGGLYASESASMENAVFSMTDKVVSQTTNAASADDASMSQLYYLHAQPTDSRYKFRGWYADEGCTEQKSNSADYVYRLENVTSTDSENPTSSIVYACFERTCSHFLKVDALPNTAGLGMVRVNDTKYSAFPHYSEFANVSSQTVVVNAANETTNGTAYLYALAKYGYKFTGWYDNAACTGSAVSTANPYTFSTPAASTDPLLPTKHVLYAKFELDATFNVTYNLPEHGQYTASVLDIVNDNGNYVWGQTQVYTSEGKTAPTAVTHYKTDYLTLSAIPDAGYKVTKWTDGSDVTTASWEYKTKVTAAKTVGVTFATTEPYKVGNNKYTTLDAAITAAGSSGTIIVVEDAYVPAGTYTIPSGVTLLVPYDANNSSYTAMNKGNQVNNAPSGQKVYRKLTLGTGATINFSGALNVSSRQNANNPYGGCVYGEYGQIEMQRGSSIIMNDGSNLYAWGYITGDGKVVANSGATIHESFQLTDFRGGNASSDFGSPSSCHYVFPMQQYYMQNIECTLEMYYGATQKVYSGISTGAGIEATGAVTVITTSGKSGLFLLASGAKLTRKYNATDDRQEYTLDGSITMSSISINVYISLNSANYVLPLVNNMSLTFNSGTATINSDMAMLADARITIKPEATLIINNKLYVYDKDEWMYKKADGSYGGYLGSSNKVLCPVPYSPSKSNVSTYRTAANMKDARIDLQGVMQCNGSVYTTKSGADICCTEGKGRYVLNSNAPADAKTYQATQISNGIPVWPAISVTSAQLHNWDDTYTKTTGASSGATFYYVRGLWLQLTSPTTDCFYRDQQEHLFVHTDDFYEVIASPSYPAAYQATDCEDLVYIHTADNCEWVPTHTVADNAALLKGMDDKYWQYNNTKGYWEEAPSFTVTFQNFNGTVLETATIYNNGTPAYTGYTPVRASDDNGSYTFTGWSPEISTVNSDVTYTAQYSCTPYEASVTAYGLTQYYTTFASALTAAKEKLGATIKLLKDVSVGSGNVTYDGSKNCTLDLNGHTISGVGGIYLLIIDNTDAEFTVTDFTESKLGKLSLTASTTNTTDAAFCTYVKNGKLYLEAGNIYLYSESTSKNAVSVRVNAGGTFVMNGGKVHVKMTQNNRVGYSTQSIGAITVNGGELRAESANGEAYAFYVTGTMTVNGGKFHVTGKTAYVAHPNASDPSNVLIKGGYYNTNNRLTDLVAPGKSAWNYYAFATTDAEKAEVGNDYNWKVAEAYNVSFNANGHGTAPSSQLIIKNTYASEPTAPSATGYTFGGWYKEASCLNAWDFSTDEVTAATILYAKWTPQTYTITYKDKDDADFSGTSWESNQPTEHTYGTATTLVNPSKPNYTFGGWYTTQACTGSAVTSLGATAYTVNITLYAKWNETTHTVTVSAGANGSVSPASVSGVGAATASGDITATPNIGYNFSDWTLPDGVTAASGYTTSSNPIHINATEDDKTITANWTMDTYNLTYEGLNGATNSNPATYTVETATITLANPGERSGYTFTGWTCGGSAITQIANGSTGDKTITANWTIDTYNLTYEGLNGATNSNPATYTVETATITLANPGTRAGYTFDGWTCGGSAITQIANGSTGDKTITANWTLNTYTLTFTVNNAQYGTVDEPSITVPYGSTLSIDGKILTVGETFVTASPEEKTAQYTYTFKQWNIEPDVMIVTSDMTIEAEFERTVNKYTITWWDAQETLENHVIAEEEYEYGATPSYTYNKPSDYAYSYEMLGWSPEIVIVTENKTYTARYKDIPLTLVVNNEQTIANNVTLNSTTVRVSGALHVANNAKLTTTDLILEAAEGSSGEVTGDIVATNVYFDLAIHADSRHWNVFGVPFEIGDLGNTKLQYKNNEETTWHDMILGSHYDIIYFDEATRASSGPVYDCWKYIEDLPAGQRTLQPGVAYSISLLYHVDTLRFTKASGKPIHYNTAVGMTNTGDATNGGWNGIANPKTYHALLATGVDMIQIHDGGEIGKDTYYAYPIANYKFVVGKAGYVQITAENSVLNVATAGGQDPIPSPVHAAPRRTNGITTSELYTIEFSAENMRTDRVYVKVDEDKADEYTIGSDVMKFSTSQARPQIWVEQYNMKLCKSTMAPVDGQTVYPLGLCAPAAGEYTITNDQSAVSGDDNTLYLTYDGLPIWNLSDAPYSIQLEKGTNTHYGLLIVRNQAPSVTTGTEVIQTGLPAAQKVIWNDQVYILRGGEVYTVTGKKVQ